MKSLLFFLIVCLFSFRNYADTTFVSGTIVGQTWTTAGSPYAVEGDILVASLTIEPGVMVIFMGDYEFEIAGVLLAVGTEQDSIKFTKADTIPGWQGIFFNFSVPGSELAFCRIDGSVNSGIRIDNSIPTIDNCFILNNSGTQGGGINVIDGLSFVLNNSIIINNSISGGTLRNGGGIYLSDNTNAVLTNCTIENNSISVSNSNNNSTGRGGGIYAGGNLTMNYCHISLNSISTSTSWVYQRTGTSIGGGIYGNSELELNNCTIDSNFVSVTSGYYGTSRGGGIYSNGILFFYNSIISYNSVSGSVSSLSRGGSGIYCSISDFNNSTVAYNYYEGIRVASDSATVQNSIIWENDLSQISGTAHVIFSDVQGGYSGTGNINLNPIFESLTSLKIVPGSPCIDAGDPNTIYNDICFPPSLGTERNDMGAHGGPGACGWLDLIIPVELTSFTSVLVNGDVKLNWSTATETNNQGFEIQRRNEESEYQKIGYVPGNGTTTQVQNYSYVDSKVANDNYFYRLKQIDFDGTIEYSNEIAVNVTIPLEFALEQNYPNPFNPTTKIKYQLPKAGFVTLKVYDVLGEEIVTLVNEEKQTGNYEVNFDAKNLSSGIYFYKLQAGDFVETRKMVVLR